MQAYKGLTAYYGDLHNHCGISYGHGSLEEAFLNAREQLDFCSVTGHALWPDMPAPDKDVQYIVDFHEEGFARLRECWPEVQRLTEAFHGDGEFVTFLSFEMHCSADGDHTVLYNGAQGEILRAGGLADLREQLLDLRRQGVSAIAVPHHIGYKRGQRGINWTAFDQAMSPVVEIISMHGCSEADENTRPFLHSMGPSDHESTMQYGLEQGHLFGVIGSTDHHSAHPGSYGHGRTGLWAAAKTRQAIWEALDARRTFALTGDRIALQFAINGQPMGSRLALCQQREIAIHVAGGAPIDCMDVVKNGRLVWRFSEVDVPRPADTDLIHTKLHLDVGWGRRKTRVDWDVRLGISEGRILSIEPRFRGQEVVAPSEKESDSLSEYHTSHWEPDGERGVRFQAITFSNPNNSTNASQGMCLEVELPIDASVVATINGQQMTIPLRRLIEGARAGRLAKIGSASYRFHRAPRSWEFDWSCHFLDQVEKPAGGDAYYIRVRQKNDQWAWSSPILVE